MAPEVRLSGPENEPLGIVSLMEALRIKMRNIKRFLAEGDKCKITLRFRGREITHQELGMALLNRIRDELADLIIVEQYPKLEGRQMIMMIAPGKRKAAAKPAAEVAPAPSI